jgi:hypothetical protein
VMLAIMELNNSLISIEVGALEDLISSCLTSLL